MNSVGHFEHARELLASGRLEDGYRALCTCLEESDSGELHVVDVYLLCAETAEHMANRRLAMRVCWEGLGRLPGSVKIAFKLGCLLMHEHRWSDAVGAFQVCVNHMGADEVDSGAEHVVRHRALRNLATCLAESDQRSRAIEAWMQFIDRSPADTEAWESVIRLSLEESDPRAIKGLVSRYEGTVGISREIAVGRATCMCFEHLPSGIQRFEELLSSQQDLFTLEIFTRILSENKQWARAATHFRTLAMLEPLAASHHLNLGQCLMLLGNFDAARAALQSALQLRPNHPGTHLVLERCQRSQSELSARQACGAKPAPEREVIVTSCFLKRPDPQRGIDWAELPDLRFALDHWIRGAISSGLTPVVLYDGIPPRILREFENGPAKSLQVSQQIGTSCIDFRYIAIKQQIERHAHWKKICHTDLFDVTIRDNPFAVLDEDVKLFVGSEPSTLGENKWMQEKWVKAWGKPVPTELARQPVLNAGIFGGDRDHVLQLVSAIAAHIERLGSMDEFANIDMAVFNAVLRLEFGQDDYWANGSPLHSVFSRFEHWRTDVALIHK